MRAGALIRSTRIAVLTLLLTVVAVSSRIAPD